MDIPFFHPRFISPRWPQSPSGLVNHKIKLGET